MCVGDGLRTQMNGVTELLSAGPGSTARCSSRQSQWGAVNISLSVLLYCNCGTMQALNGNIRVSGASSRPALDLNGNGRSFTVDLNFTVSRASCGNAKKRWYSLHSASVSMCVHVHVHACTLCCVSFACVLSCLF